MEGGAFMRSVIIGAACLLGLAACGNNDGSNIPAADGAGARTAAPVALEGPKPGLWRIVTVVDGVPGGGGVPPQEVCVKNDKLEVPTMDQDSEAACTLVPFKREGGAMVASSACSLPGGMKSDSTIRVTGDFSSRYVTQVDTRLEPAPMPQMAQTKVTMTAERLGDCPAEQ